MKKPEPRVALVHDFLLDLRGAERVFLALCELFPDADLFTAVYDPAGTEGRFAHRRIHTSFLQKLHPDATSFRRLLPLYPYAMEALDLSGYDLVLSSSSAWAHGVLPSENAVHVCYCHNPFRYAWNAREATLLRARAGRCAPRSASCCSAGASGTGSPPSASTATSPTPRRRAGASRGTSRATPRSSTRRSRSSASRPAPSATTTPCSPS